MLGTPNYLGMITVAKATRILNVLLLCLAAPEILNTDLFLCFCVTISG